MGKWISKVLCVFLFVKFFDLNSVLMTYCKLPEIGGVSYVFLQYQKLALLWRKLLLGKNKVQALLLSKNNFLSRISNSTKKIRLWFVGFLLFGVFFQNCQYNGYRKVSNLLCLSYFKDHQILEQVSQIGYGVSIQLKLNSTQLFTTCFESGVGEDLSHSMIL